MENEELQVNNPASVNETQPENPQDGIDLTSDELAAAMGFMTTMGEQSMSQNAPQDGQEPQGKTRGEETHKDGGEDIETVKSQFSDELKSLKKELKEEIKKQIEGIRNDIKSALNEE